MVPSLRHRRIRSLFLCSLLGLWLALSAFAANPAALPTQAALQSPAQGEDEWELAVAADGAGHVYVLYPEYSTSPGCDGCLLPALTLVLSNDSGSTWQAPLVLTPPTPGQFSPQIVVDSTDHRTVYAAWLQNNRKDTMLAKSADFGQSWSMAVASHNPAENDAAGEGSAGKPVLAVRGQNVYVASGHTGKMWVAASHDGGVTFSSSVVNENLNLAATLAGGATIDPEGSLYLAWAGYVAQSTSAGRINLYVSKSSTGGKSWVSNLMDGSAAPAGCTAYHCEWGYMGAQISIASDSAGVLYALWSSSPSTRRPERIYFASSTTGGATWSAKADMSTAGKTVKHALPTIAADAVGNVRIAWVDSRHSPDWDAYSRSSTNGGASWSAEASISGDSPNYASLMARLSGLSSGSHTQTAVEVQAPSNSGF